MSWRNRVKVFLRGLLACKGVLLQIILGLSLQVICVNQFSPVKIHMTDAKFRESYHFWVGILISFINSSSTYGVMSMVAQFL